MLRLLIPTFLALSLNVYAQESLYGVAATWCGPDAAYACVEWMAVCGSGSRFFVVERSSDGVAFDTAGYVQVPPYCPPNYAFTDSTAWTHQRGTALYYRIRKISDDVGEELSATSSLPLISGNAPLELLITNPVRGEDGLRIRSTTFGTAVLELIGSAGVVKTRELPLSTGITTMEWPFGSLAAGVYTLRLRTSDAFAQMRVVILP